MKKNSSFHENKFIDRGLSAIDKAHNELTTKQ